MATELVMPRLSDTMSEGTVLKWLKREGEPVRRGEVIAEIETDKATMEYESYQEGILGRIVVPEGQTVPIGTPIALILAPGEAAPPVPQAATPVAPAAPERVDAPSPPPDEVSAAETVAPLEGRVRASPVARRLAEEHGIDLAKVRGTGPSGRVTKEDVEGYLRQLEEERTRPVPAPSVEVGEEEEVVELTRMQATIVRRMTESVTTAPHFYATTEIDMAEAARLRRSLNQALGDQGNISFNDLIVKACALALSRFPEVNSSYRDGKFVRHKRVHIGVAVALPGGLVVPVIRDCDKKSLRQIAAEARELVERTRAGRFTPTEIEGSTFTVSNLGMYDIEQFTAIINQPNSGILAVGSIRPKPVVVEGQIAISERMRVTLSVDHRVFYGATAAEFLQELKRILETPALLVL